MLTIYIYIYITFKAFADKLNSIACSHDINEKWKRERERVHACVLSVYPRDVGPRDFIVSVGLQLISYLPVKHQYNLLPRFVFLSEDTFAFGLVVHLHGCFSVNYGFNFLTMHVDVVLYLRKITLSRLFGYLQILSTTMKTKCVSRFKCIFIIFIFYRFVDKLYLVSDHNFYWTSITSKRRIEIIFK